MWKIERTLLEAETTFTTCISRVRNAALKSRLERITPSIVFAEQEYIAAAEEGSLSRIRPQDHVNRSVTNAEMVAVYTGRMVNATSPGRHIYNELMASAEHGRCPFCGHRVVSTLDHHLPKTLYSALTVTPVNLIPSCSDCNKSKSFAAPNRPEDVILHPYFDDVEDLRWLYAEVVEGPIASLKFYVDGYEDWDLLTSNRVKNHFTVLGLDQLYRSQAAEEILNIRFQLDYLFNSGGSHAVKAHLQSSANSRLAARTNSWQTATYSALSESDWFCDVGFRL